MNTLRAEATFSLCELLCEKKPLPTTVQFSVVYARNSLRDLPAKLIVRPVVKWHEFSLHKTPKTHTLNWPRTGKTLFSRFLDRFEQLSAGVLFALQLTPQKCSRCSQGTE